MRLSHSCLNIELCVANVDSQHLQIPDIEDIVSALRKTPIGQVWTRGAREKLRDVVATAGLRF